MRFNLNWIVSFLLQYALTYSSLWSEVPTNRTKSKSHQKRLFFALFIHIFALIPHNCCNPMHSIWRLSKIWNGLLRFDLNGSACNSDRYSFWDIILICIYKCIWWKIVCKEKRVQSKKKIKRKASWSPNAHHSKWTFFSLLFRFNVNKIRIYRFSCILITFYYLIDAMEFVTWRFTHVQAMLMLVAFWNLYRVRRKPILFLDIMRLEDSTESVQKIDENSSWNQFYSRDF